MIIKSQDVNHITNFDYVKTINVEEVPTADGAVYYISALMKTDSKVEPKRITMACYGQEEAEIEMKRLYQAFKDNAAFFEFRPAFSVRVANEDSRAEGREQNKRRKDIGGKDMKEEKLRKKYVMAAKKAPAKVFADGKNGMAADDIRKEVIKYYEKCYIDDLEYFEREKEDDPFTMMNKRDAMNTILRATAINFNYIKESAVIGKFYDFLSKVQNSENVDLNVEYSSIVDWYITLYDLENDDYIATVQDSSQAAAFLIAHEALKAWIRRKNYDYKNTRQL